jgi:aminomethyltransferase
VLAGLGLPTDIAYMGFVDADYQGMPVRVCRSGYTGERGFEVLPRWDDAETVFRALAASVRDAGGQVAGLGARDTLRTEMGYALHGHELSVDISPVQARVGWAVGWKKPQFWGREALLAEKESGPARRLWGLRAVDRGVLRQGLTVSRDGVPVGQTTSGTFSPTLKIGIALALLDTAPGIAAGDEVTVDVRGRSLRAEVVNPPFVEDHTK